MKIAFAFFIFFLIGINDSILGVLLPSIQAFYHVTPAIIGLLFIATTIGYLVGSFSNGSLIAKFGLRQVLIGGSIIYTGGAILFSLVSLYLLAGFACTCMGLGIACLDAGLNSALARSPNNTTLLNYLHAFFGLGALFGPFLASNLLAIHWMWESFYWLLATMGAMVLIGSICFIEKQFPAHHEQIQDVRTLFSSTFKLRVVWFAVFFLLVYGGIEVSIGNWSYSLLTEGRHITPLLSGWVVSGYWLGLTCGRVFLGKLGQRVGILHLIQGCLCGIFAGMFLTWWAPSQIIAASGLWLTGFCLGPLFPTTLALMSTRVSSPLLPNVIGLLASQGNIGGALFSWGAGNIVQYANLYFFLPYMVILTVVMQILWMGLRKQSGSH